MFLATPIGKDGPPKTAPFIAANLLTVKTINQLLVAEVAVNLLAISTHIVLNTSVDHIITCAANNGIGRAR